MEKRKISGDLTTTLFYELYLTDKIGHRIVSEMVIDISDEKQLNIEWLRSRLKYIFGYDNGNNNNNTTCSYPHFKKTLNTTGEWVDVHICWEKQVYEEKTLKKQEYIEKMMNVEFPGHRPLWECVIIEDRFILFICDHTYGDGALVSKAMGGLFDEPLPNFSPNSSSSKRKNLSIFAKIYLFFKIIYLIYLRFSLKNQKNISDKKPAKFMILDEISLAFLKKIRERFSCSDGTKITINTIIHTLLVKTNSLYYDKDCISSAAMFNRRSNKIDFGDNNKLGYMFLLNKTAYSDTNANGNANGNANCDANGDIISPENVVCDVHDFMQFYKETPAIPIITTSLELLYMINKESALNLISYMNENVDFIISNYVFEYKDKTLCNGLYVSNINAMVTPCNCNQLYSVTSYGDKVNIRLTHRTIDEERLKSCFVKALDWIQS